MTIKLKRIVKVSSLNRDGDTSVKLGVQRKAALKILMQHTGMTQSDLIRMAIDYFLENAEIEASN